MTRKILTVVFAAALSLIVSPALAQDWDDIPEPEIIVPDDSPAGPAGSASSAPTGTGTGTGADAPPPKCSPDYGLVDDEANPGKKRCKTEEERNAEIKELLKPEIKPAVDEAVGASYSFLLFVGGLNFFVLLALITLLRRSNARRDKRIARVYKLAKDNEKHLDEALGKEDN